MWTAPAIGGNLPSCWYVLVLAAVGLPHRSTESSITWILTRLRVPRFHLLEPPVYAVWFVIGPDRAAFLAWRVWYIVPKAS